MDKNVINAIVAMSAVVRFLDPDQLAIFMEYTDFMSKKAVAGEIVDADTYLTAIDEFTEHILKDLD